MSSKLILPLITLTRILLLALILANRPILIQVGFFFTLIKSMFYLIQNILSFIDFLKRISKPKSFGGHAFRFPHLSFQSHSLIIFHKELLDPYPTFFYLKPLNTNKSKLLLPCSMNHQAKISMQQGLGQPTPLINCHGTYSCD